MIDMNDCDLVQLQRRELVDVIVFSNALMTLTEGFWDSIHLKCVIWVWNRQINRAFCIGKGWKTQSEWVANNEVGGVTNKVMWVCVATKPRRGLWWKPEKRRVLNVLGQVVNPTNGGRQVSPTKEEHVCRLNTAKGLLDWKGRFGYISVPTVYFKDKWVKRGLTSKELCDVLDVPGGLSDQVSEDRRN